MKECEVGDLLERTPTVSNNRGENVEHYDVIVIGAGVTGLYAVYRLCELGLSVPDFEGLNSFQGDWCHTGRWPAEGLDLAGTLLLDSRVVDVSRSSVPTFATPSSLKPFF